jgi:hypothetical protein
MFIDRFGDIILINHERPYRNIEYYIPTAFDGITVDEHTSYIDDMKAWKRYTQECTT